MANFENIKLEKGMYANGKSFTQTLEELDPSSNYSGTELESLDAYERQLKRFDIRVNGSGSDMVEKFFKTSDSSALFPEYVSRAVKQGMENANILPKIVATTTKINAMDYRTITSVPDDDDKELKRVAEGSTIPQTVIKTKDELVKLHKRGRMLVASYEAIKFQRLDLFTVTLKQIGAYIARSQLKDAINVLEGCSNNDSVAESGTLTYNDLVGFWNKFSPYELNTVIATPDIMQKLLTMSEFKDATAGLNFHATGKLITPLGAELLKSSDVSSGKLIGIDKNCALEMVQAGDVTTEYDKLIDRQLERAAITSIAGFSRIFDDASRVLSC